MKEINEAYEEIQNQRKRGASGRPEPTAALMAATAPTATAAPMIPPSSASVWPYVRGPESGGGAAQRPQRTTTPSGTS